MAGTSRESNLGLVVFEKVPNADSKDKTRECGEDAGGFMALLHGEEVSRAEEFSRKMAEQRRKATERQRRYRAKRREELLKEAGASGSALLSQSELEKRRKATERQRRHRANKKAEAEAAKKMLEAQQTLGHVHSQGASLEIGGKPRDMFEIGNEGSNNLEHDTLLEHIREVGGTLIQIHRRPRGQLVLPHQVRHSYRREDMQHSPQHDNLN